MAIITESEKLIRGTNIFFDKENKKISLVKADQLSDDGVTGVAKYSAIKDYWKSEDDLIVKPFPMLGITTEQFILQNDWTYKDEATINLLRNTGFAIQNSSNELIKQYAGIITLGNIEQGRVYYQQEEGGDAKNVIYDGKVNQCILVYDKANNIDYRNYFKLYIRSFGYTYADADLSGTGESKLSYKAYKMLLNSSKDLKITKTAAEVANSAEHQKVKIEFLDQNITRNISGKNHDFNIVIKANGASATVIYEQVQYLLSLNSNINDSSATAAKIGKLTPLLLKYNDANLRTEPGVFIEDFEAKDINNIVFKDITGEEVTYPYYVTLTLNFNNVVQSENENRLVIVAGDIAQGTAELLKDKDNVDADYTLAGEESKSVSIDFDNNTQGNRIAGSDLPITVILIGRAKAQSTQVQSVIKRQAEVVVAVNAAKERSHLDSED